MSRAEMARIWREKKMTRAAEIPVEEKRTSAL
jgi:hypothetical protein